MTRDPVYLFAMMGQVPCKSVASTGFGDCQDHSFGFLLAGNRGGLRTNGNGWCASGGGIMRAEST